MGRLPINWRIANEQSLLDVYTHSYSSNSTVEEFYVTLTQNSSSFGKGMASVAMVYGDPSSTSHVSGSPMIIEVEPATVVYARVEVSSVNIVAGSPVNVNLWTWVRPNLFYFWSTAWSPVLCVTQGTMRATNAFTSLYHFAPSYGTEQEELT
jgi:hypothetical protein